MTKTTIVAFASILFGVSAASCSKKLIDSESHRTKYVFIDGRKVELNETFDTITFKPDGSYNKNKALNRKHLKKK